MPFPPGLSTCHVYGTFYDSTGVPDSGIITLTQTPPALVVGSPAYAIDQAPIEIELDAAGVISRDVTATNNSGAGPTGWTYRVDYALRSRSQTLYTFAPAGGSIDLVTIAGAEPVEGRATLVLTVGGVGPDVNGNIPVESIPGTPGAPGRGVTGTAIVSGHLIVSYSDATQQDVGQVVGANGTNGTNGINGTNGADGQQGPPGPSPKVRHTRITSGNIAIPNTAGAWEVLAGVSLSLPAAVGDYVEIGMAGMRSPTSGMFLDACVVVSGAPAMFLTTGTGSPAVEGDPSWYPPEGGTVPYPSQDAPRGFVVEAGHLSAGSVVFGIAAKGSGSGTLYASTSFPFYLNAKNFGPCDVA
jgi:hypothetical protein